MQPGSFSLLLFAAASQAQNTGFFEGYNSSDGPAWHYAGPNNEGGYWFTQTQDAISTMQSTYWNGSYWPSTIQWIGAFLGTLVSSTDETFTNALVEYNGSVPGAQTSEAAIQTDIATYFSEVETYFGTEESSDILNDAYDDVQWVVLEWLEALKFINQYDASENSTLGQDDIAKFAHQAHIFYNVVQDKFNTSLCDGGLTWNPTLAPYKNAITNELFVSTSVSMYLYFPGDNNTDPYPNPNYISTQGGTRPPLPALAAHDPLLLNNAKEEYQWFKTHNYTNAQGLIVDGFHISDGQTSCDQRNEMVYTYNQGVVLSGLRGLWEATGDTSYLEDGYDLVNTVINATGWNAPDASTAAQWSGLGRNGIMEDYCDAPGNCTQDDLIFKGVYFHHLDLFCEPLPTETPLVPGVSMLASSSLAASHSSTCAGFAPWIEHNAWAALNTKDSSGIIGEWWGASYVNQTQAAPQYAATHVQGSTDIRNEPWLLAFAPWACSSAGLCEKQPSRTRARSVSAVHRSRGLQRRESQTVETQAQGLSVFLAAADFSLSRPPS